MKERAGLATEDEARTLASSPLLTGPTGGLAVPRPLPLDRWVERYAAMRSGGDDAPDDVAQQLPADPGWTDAGDGIVLARPGREPPPASRRRSRTTPRG